MRPVTHVKSNIFLINGFKGSLLECAEHFKINPYTVRSRILKGMDVVAAFTTPTDTSKQRMTPREVVWKSKESTAVQVSVKTEEADICDQAKSEPVVTKGPTGTSFPSLPPPIQPPSFSEQLEAALDRRAAREALQAQRPEVATRNLYANYLTRARAVDFLEQNKKRVLRKKREQKTARAKVSP